MAKRWCLQHGLLEEDEAKRVAEELGKMSAKWVLSGRKQQMCWSSRMWHCVQGGDGEAPPKTSICTQAFFSHAR